MSNHLNPIILKGVMELHKRGFNMHLAEDYSYLILFNVDLPRNGVWRNSSGETVNTAEFLIPFPPNFPYQKIGVGYAHPSYAVHIGPLTWNKKKLKNVFSCSCKYGIAGWKWCCFRNIEWDAKRGDNLLTLVGIIEASIMARIPN